MIKILTLTLFAFGLPFFSIPDVFARQLPQMNAFSFDANAEVDVPSNIQQHTLIAVHSERFYDTCGLTGKSIDRIIKSFKARNLPTVALVSGFMKESQPTSEDERAKVVQPEPLKYWVGRERPSFAINSIGGEHAVAVSGSEITMVGGFYAMCFTGGVAHSIAFHFLSSEAPLKIHLPLEGIFYHGGKERIVLGEVKMCGGVPLDLVIRDIDYQNYSFLKKWAFHDYFYAVDNQFDPKNKMTQYRTGLQWGFESAFGSKADENIDLLKTQIFIDGVKLPQEIGSGPRLVQLMFWTDGNHPFLRQ